MVGEAGFMVWGVRGGRGQGGGSMINFWAGICFFVSVQQQTARVKHVACVKGSYLVRKFEFV